MTTVKNIVKKPKSTKHYVDNKKLYTTLLHYKQDVEQAKKDHADAPPIPRYVGECLYAIATRLSLKPNFINYPFREEMISDGLENCISYLHNFDPERYDNPFAYFTQIIYYAFLRRIDKEKKQLIIKQKTLENFYFEGLLAEQALDEDDRNVTVNLDNDYMTTLVENFDRKQAEKKEKQRAKKIGVEKFYEEE